MPTLGGIIVLCCWILKELTESNPANSHSPNPGTTHQTRVGEGAETTLQVIKWH